MSDETQIVKGILEGCILKLLSRESLYGYKTVETLNELGFEVNEATVYPILSRLENKKLLSVEKRPSPYGPSRKYYFLTQSGEAYLVSFEKTWQRITTIVNHVMEENHADEK